MPLFIVGTKQMMYTWLFIVLGGYQLSAIPWVCCLFIIGMFVLVEMCGGRMEKAEYDVSEVKR